MKKIAILVLAIVMIAACPAMAINSYNRALKAKIKGQYSLDENNNVTYIRTIEVPGATKDELFARAYNFFIYNYKDKDAVVQLADKENGCIIAKGIFPDVFRNIDVLHVIRVDVKDGRARILVSLLTYSTSDPGKYVLHFNETPIFKEYPFNEDGRRQNFMMKTFYRAHRHAEKIMIYMNRALVFGNTSAQYEKTDW